MGRQAVSKGVFGDERVWRKLMAGVGTKREWTSVGICSG